MRILTDDEYTELGEAVSDIESRADDVNTAWDNFFGTATDEDEECYEQSLCDLEDEAEALRDEADTLLKKIREIKAEASRKEKEYFDEGNELFEDGD